MRQAITIAKAQWLDALQNYQEVILWIVIEAIPILVMASLWTSSGQEFPQSQISYLVTYYLLVFTITRLTSFYFEKNIQDEIRQGTFSRYLLKPLTVQKYLFWQNLGGKAFNILFLLFPILLLVSSLFSEYILFPQPVNFFLFLISLIIAYFIQFSLSLLVACSSFFIEQAFAVNHLHWMLDVVVGGYMLPLTFYPQLLQKLFHFLPFPYLYYLPASIFTGRLPLSSVLSQIFISVIWAISLYFLSLFVWRVGIKKYSSVGG